MGIDSLQQLISVLSKQERHDFRTTLQQGARTKEILKLYDALASDKQLHGAELQEKVYGKNGKNKFQLARRRLMDLVLRFLKEHIREDENHPEGRIHSALALARFLIRRHHFELAAQELAQAEAWALQLHQYDLLASIYALQLAHIDQLHANADQLTAKANENLERLILLNKLNIAFGEVRQKLNSYRKEGLHFDTEQTIRAVIGKVRFQRKTVLLNPAFVLRFMELVRSVVVSGKEYQRFQPYLVRAYTMLKNYKAFEGPNAWFESDFLYMLAHVHYRTRQFHHAAMWLEKLYEHLDHLKFNKQMQANALMIEAGLKFFTGELDAAKNLLREGLEKWEATLPAREKYSMKLNLAVYHFFAADYKTSVRLMNTIPMRSKALEEEMGREWFFKRDMIEVIFQYENGNIDGAHHLLPGVLKYYGKMLNEPIYQRARTFIGFVQHFFDYPEEVTEAPFVQRVKEARAAWRDQAEDVQAMVFFSWLSSKMARRSAYHMLLERVGAEKV